MEPIPAIPAESAAPKPDALEYAPRPPTRKRRWFGRLVLAFVLLAIVAAAALWGRQVFERGLLLYHQRACMNYTAPPDQVVFDSNPARVAKLANDPNFIIFRGCAFRRMPDDWQAVRAVLTPPWGMGMPRAPLFLHERHAPSGQPRIVSVGRTEAADHSAYFISGYDVYPHVIEPAEIGRPPRGIPTLDINYTGVLDSTAPHTDIRIFAGQPDPADPSHFTIRYESGGKTHIVDGTLDEDDRVTLNRRPEAAEGPQQK